MSRAFKFLGAGAVGTLTGFTWPTPGVWVDVHGPLDPCRNGIHVCRPHELAHWLHDELWELEVEGEEVEAVDCFVVRRARLVRRVAGWDPAGTERFATACIERAAPAAAADILADARDAARAGFPAVAAYAAALAVARATGDLEATYAAERAWQSAWIARELL